MRESNNLDDDNHYVAHFGKGQKNDIVLTNIKKLNYFKDIHMKHQNKLKAVKLGGDY